MVEFGLPPSFSLDNYKRADASLDAKRSKATLWIVLGTMAAILLALIGHFGSAAGFGIGFTVLFWAWIPITLAATPTVKRLVTSSAPELLYRDQVKAYNVAIARWHDMQTEGGQGYWTVLRGIAFEQAVANFFRRRGCVANLTDVTGDGGVDVVLTVGSRLYWCQCKGHAKPIPVAEIRRIAGATLKSKGKAKPVMFATNGYTKPALTEAEELGVLCFDAKYLATRATTTVITSL